MLKKLIKDDDLFFRDIIWSSTYDIDGSYDEIIKMFGQPTRYDDFPNTLDQELVDFKERNRIVGEAYWVFSIGDDAVVINTILSSYNSKIFISSNKSELACRFYDFLKEKPWECFDYIRVRSFMDSL